MLDLIESPALPYFIKWDTPELHPASDANAQVAIKEIALSASQDQVEHWLGDKATALLTEVNVNWVADDDAGVQSVTFSTPSGLVVID